MILTHHGNFDVEATGADVVKALGGNAAGKIILITGPSKNSIGAKIAKTLANANPSQLLLAGRNEAKVDPLIKEIQQANPEINVTFIQCDLSDNASVRRAVTKINSLIGRLDVLINNAGIMAVRSFQKSVDGVESQFAAGYLGHFLLTNLIMDKIVAAKCIVINMTSSAYMLDEVDTQDPNFDEGRNYNLWNAYARTKTAGILFAVAIADKFGAKGVTSFAVDPGRVKGTNRLVSSGVGDLMKQGMDMAVVRNGGNPLPPHPMVSIQQGVAGAVLLSLDAFLGDQSPAFVKECCVTPTLPYASDKEIANELWKLSEKLVRQTFNA